MPVGMLLAGEAVTEETYRLATEKMFGNFPMRPDQAPEGCLLHTAGTSDQGWYVYDIWESPEHFQRFAEERLGAAMAEIVPAGTEQPHPVFFEIATLVQAQ